MRPSRESLLESALEAPLSEVTNICQDYPAEAWRFSKETISDAENALNAPKAEMKKEQQQ